MNPFSSSRFRRGDGVLASSHRVDTTQRVAATGVKSGRPRSGEAARGPVERCSSDVGSVVSSEQSRRCAAAALSFARP